MLMVQWELIFWDYDQVMYLLLWPRSMVALVFYTFSIDRVNSKQVSNLSSIHSWDKIYSLFSVDYLPTSKWMSRRYGFFSLYMDSLTNSSDCFECCGYSKGFWDKVVISEWGAESIHDIFTIFRGLSSFFSFMFSLVQRTSLEQSWLMVERSTSRNI